MVPTTVWFWCWFCGGFGFRSALLSFVTSMESGLGGGKPSAPFGRHNVHAMAAKKDHKNARDIVKPKSFVHRSDRSREEGWLRNGTRMGEAIKQKTKTTTKKQQNFETKKTCLSVNWNAVVNADCYWRDCTKQRVLRMHSNATLNCKLRRDCESECLQ